MRNFLKIYLSLISPLVARQSAHGQPHRLRALASPVLLRGDVHTAYRDPAVLYEQGTFYLYYTLVETEANGRVYSYVPSARAPN